MRFVRLALALCVASAVISAFATGVAAASTIAGTASDGAYVVSETPVDSRTIDVTIYSPAVNGDAGVELMLPPGWSPTASQTWPVLYLLHGCCDTAQTWRQKTNIEQETAGAPVILASPDGGPAGLYTNWWNNGRRGENWQTFTAVELPQILQSGFRAGAARDIVGLSTGGGAALAIAATYHGQYRAVASYSGMDCTELPQTEAAVTYLMLANNVPALAVWGSPIFNFNIWAANDPCALAGQLRGTRIFLSTGNGLTSAGLPDTCPSSNPDQTEPGLLESAVATVVYTFAADLIVRGIPYTSNFYSGGCHAWPWWSTAFDESWPMLESALRA